MKCRFLLTVGVILWSTWSGFAIEKTTVSLDNLVKTFEQIRQTLKRPCNY